MWLRTAGCSVSVARLIVRRGPAEREVKFRRFVAAGSAVVAADAVDRALGFVNCGALRYHGGLEKMKQNKT